MRNFTSIFILLCCIIASSITAFSQPAISYQLVQSGFTMPVKIAFAGAGDSRMFVCENPGKIKIVSNGVTLPTPFLDLTSKTDLSGETGGLLSMVFHPQYASNGYFFVIYTEKKSTLSTSNAITLVRYHVSSTNPNVADTTSAKVLFKIEKPILGTGRNREHNGSDLHFGKDGNLYISTGDGNSSNPGDVAFTAQNNQLLLGKILRINVNNFNTPPYYTIPLFNPFYLGASNNAKKEIYCSGLRNPYRWSFDRLNGDMYIGDVGEDTWEEVDYTSAGTKAAAAVRWLVSVIFNVTKRYPVANYGWSCYEATDRYVNFSLCDSTSNFTFPFYKYTNSQPGLHLEQSVVGGYVYRGSQYPSLYGYYLFMDLYYGRMYFSKRDNTGHWITTVQQHQPLYMSTFGEDQNGELYVANIATGNVSKIVVSNAVVNASKPAPLKTITSTSDEPNKIYPTVTTSPSFKVALNKPATSLQVVSIDGSIVYQQSLKNQSGTISIHAPMTGKGMYLVKIYTTDGVETHKLVIE